jgi:hypothetical protein
MLYLLVRGMAGVLYMVDVEVVGLFVNTQRSRPGHLRDFLAPRAFAHVRVHDGVPEVHFSILPSSLAFQNSGRNLECLTHVPCCTEILISSCQRLGSLYTFEYPSLILLHTSRSLRHVLRARSNAVCSALRSAYL